jgi:hypothetical protein
MSEESWIPADRWPELGPVAEEWKRRSAAVAEARARREALGGRTAVEEDRARREALAEAYASGAEELPEAPLTAEERRIALADAEEHLAAAQRALAAYGPEVAAVFAEHVDEWGAEFAETAAAARAEREAAERVIAEASERIAAAKREEAYAERYAEWLRRAAAGSTAPPPTKYRIKRGDDGPVVLSLVEIANRGVTPSLPPVGLVSVDPDAEGGEYFATAQVNAEATKRRIAGMDAAEEAERAARIERERRVLPGLPKGA